MLYSPSSISSQMNQRNIPASYGSIEASLNVVSEFFHQKKFHIRLKLLLTATIKSSN
jgi:hypothetical protein